MKRLSDENLAVIIKYTRYPASFARVNKRFSNISKRPEIRYKWLFYHYGRVYALFFAIFFGRYFISVDMVKYALKNGALLSRYLLQKLFKNYGLSDLQLINYKSNNTDINDDILRHRLESLWGSNLPLAVYLELLKEGGYRWIGKDLCLKGNDLELFY